MVAIQPFSLIFLVKEMLLYKVCFTRDTNKKTVWLASFTVELLPDYFELTIHFLSNLEEQQP